MRKKYIIVSVIILIIVLLSVVLGFFIKEKYFNKENIITGEKENIIAEIDKSVEITEVSTPRFYKKNKLKIFLYGVKNVKFTTGEDTIELLNDGRLSVNTLDYILYREVIENKASFEKNKYCNLYEFDDFYVCIYEFKRICFISKDKIKKEDIVFDTSENFVFTIQEKEMENSK